MTTANGYLLTSTNQEAKQHPHRSFNATTSKTLTQAIAATDLDTANDLLSFMKIPDGMKIERIDYGITDYGDATCDLDIVILENIDGTATTTTLLNSGGLGNGATTFPKSVLPSASGTYIHQVAETDDGYGTLQLKQIGATPAGTATFYVTVFYS